MSNQQVAERLVKFKPKKINEYFNLVRQQHKMVMDNLNEKIEDKQLIQLVQRSHEYVEELYGIALNCCYSPYEEKKIYVLKNK